MVLLMVSRANCTPAERALLKAWAARLPAMVPQAVKPAAPLPAVREPSTEPRAESNPEVSRVKVAFNSNASMRHPLSGGVMPKI